VGHRLPFGYVQSTELAERPANERVRTIAMVVDLRRITTRQSRSMAIVTMEDLTGTMEVVVFPDTFERVKDDLVIDAILEVTGKVDRRNDDVQIIVDAISRELPQFEVNQGSPDRAVSLRLEISGNLWDDISLMQRVDRVLKEHVGTMPVELQLPRGNRVARLRSRSRRVEWSDELKQELESVLGNHAVELVTPEARANQTFAA
jgi:DNA polymerase-3 subunit alpha